MGFDWGSAPRESWNRSLRTNKPSCAQHHLALLGCAISSTILVLFAVTVAHAALGPQAFGNTHQPPGPAAIRVVLEMNGDPLDVRFVIGNTDNLVYDALSGRIMTIDLADGTVRGTSYPRCPAPHEPIAGVRQPDGTITYLAGKGTQELVELSPAGKVTTTTLLTTYGTFETLTPLPGGDLLLSPTCAPFSACASPDSGCKEGQ